MPPKRIIDDGEDSNDSDGSKGMKRVKYEKGTDEYTKRRERNNIAVKKSREKSRQKAKETSEQVKRLTAENESLVQKVTILSKELSVLKDLFLAHAGNVTVTCGVEGALNGTQADSADHEYSKLKVQTK